MQVDFLADGSRLDLRRGDRRCGFGSVVQQCMRAAQLQRGVAHGALRCFARVCAGSDPDVNHELLKPLDLRLYGCLRRLQRGKEVGVTGDGMVCLHGNAPVSGDRVAADQRRFAQPHLA